MFGHSMTTEELKKLSYADRLRRGYFDQVPLNFALIGLTASVHLFSIRNTELVFFISLACFSLGMVLKNKFLEKDDAELNILARGKGNTESKKI